MGYRTWGGSFNRVFIAVFAILFALQVAAQSEQGEDVTAQPTAPAKKSFLETLMEVGVSVAGQALEETAERETRKAQGFYKGKIESVNVVEQRGNSVTVDIAYKGIKQHQGVRLRVNALSAGFSNLELSNFQGNISGNSGRARVLMYWSNPLNQAEVKTDQLEVILYRDTGDLEEPIDTKYTDLRKTWTPFDELVDSADQMGGLELDDELADVEDLGEETCSSKHVWIVNQQSRPHWESRRAGDTTCYPNQPSVGPVVRDHRAGSGTSGGVVPPPRRPSAGGVVPPPRRPSTSGSQSRPVGCSPLTNQVTFFEHANYKGACVTHVMGRYANAQAIGIGNDKISSIKVGSNTQVALCKDSNFKGGCSIYRKSMPNFGAMNDQTSSASISRYVPRR